MKNKALFRELLAPAYPDFFFKQATLADLPALNPDNFSYPFVLKAKVGFFSVGVYPITCRKDCDAACWNFGKVLCLRKVDFHQHPIYGFIFTEIDENDERTRRRITKTNFDLFAQNANRTQKAAIKTR